METRSPSTKLSDWWFAPVTLSKHKSDWLTDGNNGTNSSGPIAARESTQEQSDCHIVTTRPAPVRARAVPPEGVWWADQTAILNYPAEQPEVPTYASPHHHLLYPHLISNRTRWDGRMSKASVSHFGRYGDPNLTSSHPGRVEPMTLKLILVAS